MDRRDKIELAGIVLFLLLMMVILMGLYKTSLPSSASGAIYHVELYSGGEVVRTWNVYSEELTWTNSGIRIKDEHITGTMVVREIERTSSR